MAENKEYYTLDEASEKLGRNRATIYNRMNILGITGRKFKRDRKTYLSAAEVEQIRDVFKKPWLAGEDKKDINAA